MQWCELCAMELSSSSVRLRVPLVEWCGEVILLMYIQSSCAAGDRQCVMFMNNMSCIVQVFQHDVCFASWHVIVNSLLCYACSNTVLVRVFPGPYA